jgi:hypothetical protein
MEDIRLLSGAPGTFEKKAVRMEQKRGIVIFLILSVSMVCLGRAAGAVAGGEVPVLQMMQTEHTFPPVFEGAVLSHTFQVINGGSGVLHIRKVSEACGCMAIRYDRVIPPGGRGAITLTLDTRVVRGAFEKGAAVWSDDPERGFVPLYLRGEVKPHVLLEPGAYLSLQGVVGKVGAESLEIKNNREMPLELTGLAHDLAGRIRCRLRVIKTGYVYRLQVEDISNQAGTYTGRVRMRTNLAEKPELVIIISGAVQGE